MELTDHLQRATAAFQRQLNEVKASLGSQGIPWYPYDTFGSTRPVDELLAPNSFELVKKLTGDLPVLDVGCGDGDLSFFLESLGCEIDAVDYPPTNHNGMRGIRCLREALGSKVAIHPMDIDAQFHPPRPLYGLTLFLGILYHLKNPFQVLERLAEHSQFCLLSTRIAQSTPDGARMSDEALAYLVGEYELNADNSNYWIFSEAGLRRLLERSGWRLRGLVKTGNTASSEPVRLDRDERATCLIESLRAPQRDAARLISGWYGDEGGWQWTAREFAVEMPPHPLDGGSVKSLEFRFIVNADVAAVLGTVTLRARVGGQDLGAQTFQGAGEHIYKADLPVYASELPAPAPQHVNSFPPAEGNLRIDFALDRAYQAPGGDRRELGLQVAFVKCGAAHARHFSTPVRLV